ncbi:transcriptional regulator [Methylacidiphilum kamchatkense Kam1]|uniref:LysR family transcriptional activator of glutamate synthase operon n=1 Tax=Methylacidiphilum kamchatkense Kam1 TaxID=1202785 RepID=A0A0C1UP73_9BACT|nr:LysR family transcriptional regulator [Methylacidiphilum kamchatkense]KIE58274.1 transcriptional regulator [Methylacidiphilum kamchatkense Kam1]QDQ42332.1 LysR family transcriptional activator of glutamate synthase operon [Methylacidiphilum kamchatkense Kam1]
MAYPIDSRALYIFVNTAESESFSQAAKSLHLSQPAVSRTIQSLEEELGCRLFDREGKNPSLTAIGKEFLVLAKEILAGMEKARIDIENLKREGPKKIVFSTSSLSCQYFIPQLYREFQESFPDCLFSIIPANSPLAIELVEQKKVDFALTIKPIVPFEGLAMLELFQDEVLFLVSSFHPLTRKKDISKKEIETAHYLIKNKNDTTFHIVEKAFAEQSLYPKNFIELAETGSIKEMVKMGLGIGILPGWIAKEELKKGKLLSLSLIARPIIRKWVFVYKMGRKLSLLETTFLELCKTILPKKVS